MRMHNLHGTEKEKEENESSNDDEESDDEDDDEDKKPKLEIAMMPHYGSINRVRVRRPFLYRNSEVNECFLDM